MELYMHWKIQSSLYVHLYLGKYRMNINNYKGLQVITAVMISTCMGVGCNYYEFQSTSSICMHSGTLRPSIIL